MSILAVEAPPVPPLTRSPAAPAGPWLVGPWFDLFFLANLAWPVFGLLAMLGGGSSPLHDGLTFWQVYVLSTPHRWITLSLVFLDRDRFVQRPVAYLGIAFLAVVLVLSYYLSTQTLALLLAIDYLWNAWHFAAQHSGISRIYGRVARPGATGSGLLEKFQLRVFVLYVIFRLGVPLMGSSLGDEDSRADWLLWLEWLMQRVQVLDLAMLALPASLLVRELWQFRRSALGRLAYLGNVCLLYSLLLLSVHYNHDNRLNAAILGLGLAISMMHSTEYLAIVSWSVWKRHGRGKSSLFAHLVPRWGFALVTFMCVLALSGWFMDQHFLRAWVIVTIIVSYLHYAYDGMIWKVRRPASAAVA